MTKPVQTSTQDIYEIRIHGELDDHWSSWFNGVMIACEPLEGDFPVTLLTVRIPDQARLRGIMNKIWDLNLTVLSVARGIGPGTTDGGSQ